MTAWKIMPALERRLAHRLQQPNALTHGLRDLLLIGIAYAGAIGLLAWAGVGPGMEPWLRIPTATYFAWEIAFTPAVIFFSGLLAAAVTQLFARWLGGTGSFEGTLALIGPATAWATLCTLIPDVIAALLLLAGVIDPAHWMADIVRPSPILGVIWIYLLLYVAAFLLLYPMVVRLVHGLSGWRSRWCGWLAFIIYQAMLLVFIR